MTDPFVNSCEHPNENPSSCPCAENCYCRLNHCAGKTIPAARAQPRPPRKVVVGDYRARELVELGREIWGDHHYRLDEIIIRLMVGIGDLSRLCRSGEPRGYEEREGYRSEVKKELGNVILSTLRWCDDLGYDVTECLTLAIEAQRKFAQSGKPR